jgi:hypothetical protein
MGAGGSLPGVKRQGLEADNSSPSSAEVKNDGAIPPLPIRLHGVVLNYIIKCRDNFTFFTFYMQRELISCTDCAIEPRPFCKVKDLTKTYFCAILPAEPTVS